MTEERVVPAAYIESDVADLKEVIVLAPSPSHFIETGLRDENFGTFTGSFLRENSLREHKQFVSILEKYARCLNLSSLLDSALAHAEKKWIESLLQNLHPAPENALSKKMQEVTADVLLGRSSHSPHPLRWMFFTRDIFVSTPRGIVLCNFLNYDRYREPEIARFLFDFSPELENYNIVFDAEKEGVLLQGGDVIVKDSRSLIIGVGNTTEQEAARKIAARLELDVVAVQMPSCDMRGRAYADWNGVNSLFYHLDSILNFINYKKALALPYFLEEQYRDSNPYYDYLRDTDKRIQTLVAQPGRHGVYFEEPLKVIEQLKDIGTVTIYEAGSAKERRTGYKIVDYLREQGYSIIPVGGGLIEPSGQSVVERVLWELKWQAANVVSLKPGHVIAYSGNPHTLAALEEAGIKVEVFDGDELVRGHGGPHCLTAPLARTTGVSLE